MAKKRSIKRTAPRRAYGPKKRGRRKNTLNKSTKKPMQAVGVAVGLASVYGAPIAQSVAQKSIKPISGAIMNKDTAIRAGKNALIGAVAGTAVGIGVDKFGLKKPVNRVLRTVRKFTGGLI
jgi:hypothetical protein